jgi:hypothetical protein
MGSLLLFLVACTPVPPGSEQPLSSVTLRGPQGEALPLVVEIADDHAERARGLMFRTELARDRGMLFLFAEEQILSFWMKNTLIPLDIIFFDREGRFISAATMAPCRADPCPSYPSEGKASMALEVAEGFVAEQGIGAGWALVRE